MKKQSDYSNRNEYRNKTASDLCCWQTEHKQTELFICADKTCEKESIAAVMFLRKIIDEYIINNEDFEKSLVPLTAAPNAPKQIIDMCTAAKAAGVGPMAAVAGVFAKHVGSELLKFCSQVIVENGGDVFIKTDIQRIVAINAGKSPLSMKIGLKIEPSQKPIAVCTSSGTVGPSKSFGRSDAAVVVSHDACLADACATRLGNEIKRQEDIKGALEFIIGIKGVIGAVAVLGKTCGAAGQITLENL